MNIFHTILQKLGIEKTTKDTTPAMSVTAGASIGTPAGKATTAPGSVGHAVAVVDVMSKLEGLASSHPGLDWKVSIADLLQLLGIDNSYEARKALATELGCPADMMSDSARMNVWLHKTVLQKIAENGGNVPASLMD